MDEDTPVNTDDYTDSIVLVNGVCYGVVVNTGYLDNRYPYIELSDYNDQRVCKSENPCPTYHL